MKPFDNVFHTNTSSCQLHLNSQLQIVQSGKVARELLEQFFKETLSTTPETLPRKIENWIRKNIQNGAFSDSNEPTLLSTTFHKHSRILIALISRSSNADDYTLLLVEDQQAYEKYEKLQKQLTRRQFEMYNHIKDGERDLTTIAQKMGISVRTAEGHKMHLKRVVTDV